MIRQEPKVHFLYENVSLGSFLDSVPTCEEVEFAAFEDVHAKSSLRIGKNADLEIRLRRDGPPQDQWLAKGVIRILLWNSDVQIDGFYPANFCNEKPFHVVDLMSRKSLQSEVGEEVFNVDVSIKFDKWEGLKVIKLFQFDHRYLDSNLNLNVQGHDFYVRSKTVFKEIPALREYLEQNFEAGTKQYVISDLQGEKSMPAFETMLQVAFRCSFITNLHEVGEVLSLAFRFDYPQLKKKCEYYLMNEPESEWFQKLAFADLYDLPLLRQHVLDNTVGLRQICKHLHYHRFLSTETLRSILAKALEMSDLKQFGEEPPSGWQTPCLHKITENRWERLKRVPVVGGIVGEPDVTEAVEKFESTFMPKHFGVELITPHFSFAEKKLNLFNYNIQLGPDHRLLYKLEWNNVQPANLVWSVDATVLIRMQYLGSHSWEHSERVCFDYDHQSIFFDGLHIQKVFPGGVEHLLDGLGSNPTLPMVEMLVMVQKIRGLQLDPKEMVEEMDDEWILQPARNSPIVCCGKYVYVDKDVLRAKSRIFSKIFEQTYEPITIPLLPEKFDVFAGFLDILHGEDVHFNYQNVFLIAEFARCYQVEDLLNRVVDWLIEEPGMSKIQKLELSVIHAIPELQKFVTENIVSLDELLAMLEGLPNFSRRVLQLLQDRMCTLPLPSNNIFEE
ncbi:unnamed protein product [Caenorhabditis sp. 36 PRJEB53466]|nr:unnamed protein product [Caenorhabditis sp. 36 PRJEB53466]